jgi:hypothetical protein
MTTINAGATAYAVICHTISANGHASRMSHVWQRLADAKAFAQACANETADESDAKRKPLKWHSIDGTWLAFEPQYTYGHDDIAPRDTWRIVTISYHAGA